MLIRASKFINPIETPGQDQRESAARKADSGSAYSTSHRSPGGREGPGLPAVMSEGLIGLCHSVRVVLLFDRASTVVGGIH